MAENSKKSDNKSTTEEMQQQKRCFVMMPFSDPEGYDKGHFRKIYEQIIIPAIKNAGYKPDRVDENGVSDLITTKIFQSILDCEMAICDLSSRNPNVLYELGIRHAFDKPVVLITDDKTERIFDIQGISTITYRSSRLYDEVPEDQRKITEAIKANENNSSGYSILNMINLQKASYDASIKDTDSPEINNALLMRIVNALEKTEQNPNNFDKQIYNTSRYATGITSITGIIEADKMQVKIDQIEFELNELNDEVDHLISSNTSIDSVDEIESKILEIKMRIRKLRSSSLLTTRQQELLNGYSDKSAFILHKIKEIKENSNNS